MGEVCRKGEIEGKRGEKESRGRRRRRGEEVIGGNQSVRSAWKVQRKQGLWVSVFAKARDGGCHVRRAICCVMPSSCHGAAAGAPRNSGSV